MCSNGTHPHVSGGEIIFLHVPHENFVPDFSVDLVKHALYSSLCIADIHQRQMWRRKTIFQMKKKKIIIPKSNDGRVHSIDFVRPLNQTNVLNVQHSLEIGGFDTTHAISCIVRLFAHKIAWKVRMQTYGETSNRKPRWCDSTQRETERESQTKIWNKKICNISISLHPFRRFWIS